MCGGGGVLFSCKIDCVLKKSLLQKGSQGSLSPDSKILVSFVTNGSRSNSTSNNAIFTIYRAISGGATTDLGDGSTYRLAHTYSPNPSIQTLQKDFALQTQGLLNLQNKNQEIELEMSRYLDIFKRHNLSKLAAAKPGLIETRVNNGTKEVFESIEQDSRNIDSLDDGLQLQSNP